MRTPGHPSTIPLPRRRASVGRGGFTLVELLVTMSIASLLLGLLIAGIRGFNAGSNRRSAVGTLMGVFDQARTVAISDGRATYVVFVSAPKGQTDLTASVFPATMWGQAYALFEDPVISDSTKDADFFPVQRSTWLTLPTGIAFKCDNGSDTMHLSVTATPRSQMSQTTDDTTFKIVSRSTNVSTDMKLPYVKFDATGQIVDHRGYVVDANSPVQRLLLFEGTATSSGTEVHTHRNGENAADGNKYALDEIMLKPITGRASYTLDPSNNLVTTTTASP